VTLANLDLLDAQLALREYEAHAALVWRLGVRGDPLTCDLIAARERFLIVFDERSLDAFRLRLAAWFLAWQRTQEDAEKERMTP